MNQRARDFIVGLTVLLGLAGLATMLVAFGELEIVHRDRYPLELRMASVDGIGPASVITLNGVEVGRVAGTSTDADPRRGVRLALEIDRDVRVPRDVRVSIDRNLLGESTLALTTPPLAPDAPAPTDADFLAEGDVFEREAQGMLEQIGSMLDERLVALTDAADAVRRLSDTYVRVGEKIELLVEPRSPEAVDAGDEGANLASAIARVDGAVRDARLWLGDAEARDDAKAGVRSARAALESLAVAVEDWTEAARAVSRNADRLGERGDEALREFVATTDTLADALTEMRVIAARINAGEGTAGLLVNNPDLYRSLNDAAIRLEQTLLETKLLVEKYRKEGVPIQF